MLPLRENLVLYGAFVVERLPRVERAKMTLAVLRRVVGSHDLPLPPRLSGLMMHFEAADGVGPSEQEEEAAIEFFDEFKAWWDTEVRPSA